MPSYDIVEKILNDRKYVYKRDAKKDIDTALKQFSELAPKEETYVYPNGVKQILLCLYGTIPVHYDGNKYNIPVQIWTFTNHPNSPPLVFVKPTSSMVIKANQYVDQQGRVYHPYLTQWKRPNSDTYGLINMLCMAFGEICPVYSRQAPRPTMTRPPYPGAMGLPNNMGGPGYPVGGGGMPTPYGQQPVYSPSQFGQPTNPISQANTPYPASSAYQQSPAANQNTRGPPPPPSRQESTIGEDVKRASLLSSVETKLKRRIEEVFQMGKGEIEKLQETKSGLEKGNRDLQDMIERMKNEKANLNSNISLLSQKISEADEQLNKMEGDSENMKIDDVVIASAPLYNQILELFAEENAVEDTIYYLSEALRREAIELDQYLKAVRKLSRKQFVLRATLQKARVTAGLSA